MRHHLVLKTTPSQASESPARARAYSSFLSNALLACVEGHFHEHLGRRDRMKLQGEAKNDCVVAVGLLSTREGS